MQPRHLASLLNRLDRVIDNGCVEITPVELLLWFNQERMTHTVWRDIYNHWISMTADVKHIKSDEMTQKLLVGSSDVSYVIIWGNGLKTSENSWFKDMRDLAKIKYNSENWENE